MDSNDNCEMNGYGREGLMETMIFNYGFGDQIAESGVKEEILSSRVIPDYSHGMVMEMISTTLLM